MDRRDFIGLMVRSEAEGRLQVCLNEDKSDDCSCNDEAFDAFGFHGLDSVDVSETSGSGSENEVENPKAFVFVAFDALVISEYGDTIGKGVPIHVNETGTEESDCSVNAFE
jgi:hypothetical protein